jgi:hypothetical protein
MTQVSAKSVVFCVVNFHLWREVDEISGRDLMSSFYVSEKQKAKKTLTAQSTWIGKKAEDQIAKRQSKRNC